MADVSGASGWVRDIGPRLLDIASNVISGTIVAAIVFWILTVRDRRLRRDVRTRVMDWRRSRAAILQSELDTFVSFVSQCETAAAALDHFTSYQQWLVSNHLLSYRMNRQVVQSWQQMGGSAVTLRMGNVPIAEDVLQQLTADLRKTELPPPEDDCFRWQGTLALDDV